METTNIMKNEQPTEQIRMDEVRLTPAQAAELSEIIITTEIGIFSADAEDDKPKQALLILLSALAYEDNSTNRENILFAVSRKIFSYSFANDKAENQFIEDGFEWFSINKNSANSSTN